MCNRPWLYFDPVGRTRLRHLVEVEMVVGNLMLVVVAAGAVCPSMISMVQSCWDLFGVIR